MSYSGCQRVAELLPNLMGGASSLDGMGAVSPVPVPASVAYVRWLSSGCAMIESALVGAGYSVPVPATSKLYDFVADLEAQYAAYRAEQSRGSTRSGTGDRTRADGFKAAFDDGIKYLKPSDPSRDGMTATSKVYSGGMEVSDKDIDQGDTDMVQPRFARGVFDGESSANANSPRGAS